MNKSKPITAGQVVSWLTGVNIEDVYNAFFESMREISRQVVLAIEKLEEAERIMDSDPIVGLLHRICDGDTEAISQLVRKYTLYERSLSHFERAIVRQQLPKQMLPDTGKYQDPIIEIAMSAVCIWVAIFAINYGYYFSLPQKKREGILANIIGHTCRRELLGEIADLRKRVDITPEELEQGYNEDDEDRGRQIKKIESQARRAGSGQLPLATYDNLDEDDDLDLNDTFLKDYIPNHTRREKEVLMKILAGLRGGDIKIGSKRGDSLRQYLGEDYKRDMEILRKLRRKLTI